MRVTREEGKEGTDALVERGGGSTNGRGVSATSATRGQFSMAVGDYRCATRQFLSMLPCAFLLPELIGGGSMSRASWSHPWQNYLAWCNGF